MRPSSLNQQSQVAFSHQASKVVSACALALLGDTLDCFQQNHPRLTAEPRELSRGFWLGSLPLARASESPIAIACFLLFTVLPLPPCSERAPALCVSWLPSHVALMWSTWEIGAIRVSPFGEVERNA